MLPHCFNNFFPAVLPLILFRLLAEGIIKTPYQTLSKFISEHTCSRSRLRVKFSNLTSQGLNQTCQVSQGVLISLRGGKVDGPVACGGGDGARGGGLLPCGGTGVSSSPLRGKFDGLAACGGGARAV